MESLTKAGDKWPSHIVIRGRYQRTVITVSHPTLPPGSPSRPSVWSVCKCVHVCDWVKLTLSTAGCIPCIYLCVIARSSLHVVTFSWEPAQCGRLFGFAKSAMRKNNNIKSLQHGVFPTRVLNYSALSKSCDASYKIISTEKLLSLLCRFHFISWSVVSHFFNFMHAACSIWDMLRITCRITCKRIKFKRKEMQWLKHCKLHLVNKCKNDLLKYKAFLCISRSLLKEPRGVSLQFLKFLSLTSIWDWSDLDCAASCACLAACAYISSCSSFGFCQSVGQWACWFWM